MSASASVQSLHNSYTQLVEIQNKIIQLCVSYKDYEFFDDKYGELIDIFDGYSEDVYNRAHRCNFAYITEQVSVLWRVIGCDNLTPEFLRHVLSRIDKTKLKGLYQHSVDLSWCPVRLTMCIEPWILKELLDYGFQGDRVKLSSDQPQENRIILLKHLGFIPGGRINIVDLHLAYRLEVKPKTRVQKAHYKEFKEIDSVVRETLEDVIIRDVLHLILCY